MDIDYFYSLVNVNQERKKRKCLRCRRGFVSSHAGHRICGACRCIISGQGHLASGAPDHYTAQQTEEAVS
jgi:ribosomal protein S27AE